MQKSNLLAYGNTRAKEKREKFIKKRKKHFQKAKKYVTIGVYNMMGEYLFSGYMDFTKEEFFDFSKHSSIGVGGVARVAFYPKSTEEIKQLVSRLKRDDLKHIVLGNLTNVLPPDETLEKVVISTKKLVESRIGEQVYVSAGVTSACLLKACRYAKKSGAEFLAGIPCTIGGALYMNAGVNGRYIAEIVESVDVYRDGEIIKLSVNDCKYAYKQSVFMQNNDVILGATLCLTDSDEKHIAAQIGEYIERRKHLPKGKSMGCVFKNPLSQNTKISAGEWIEKSGLKGARCGGAYVSNQHANFIINDGGATSKDVKELIKLIKERVLSQHNIRLEEEIAYLE